MFAEGADGCRGGWVVFRVDGISKTSESPYPKTSVRVEGDLSQLVRNCPEGGALLGIDIPIGLIESSRECDLMARKLLGKRGSSVFPAPCRAALSGRDYREGSEINLRETGKKLTIQAWGIIPKIKQIDDALLSGGRDWVFEVHPELCFREMNRENQLQFSKKKKAGKLERSELIRRFFPRIEEHLAAKDRGVAEDDLLDAAAAAWTAIRRYQGESRCIGDSCLDARGLPMRIYF